MTKEQMEEIFGKPVKVVDLNDPNDPLAREWHRINKELRERNKFRRRIHILRPSKCSR